MNRETVKLIRDIQNEKYISQLEVSFWKEEFIKLQREFSELEEEHIRHKESFNEMFEELQKVKNRCKCFKSERKD